MKAVNRKARIPDRDADLIDSAVNEPFRSLRGMRAVVEALRLEDFPMEKQDIDYTVGDIEVEDGHGGYLAVRDLTDQLHDESFSSAESVIKALQRILQQEKRKTA